MMSNMFHDKRAQIDHIHLIYKEAALKKRTLETGQLHCIFDHETEEALSYSNYYVFFNSSTAK